MTHITCHICRNYNTVDGTGHAIGITHNCVPWNIPEEYFSCLDRKLEKLIKCRKSQTCIITLTFEYIWIYLRSQTCIYRVLFFNSYLSSIVCKRSVGIHFVKYPRMTKHILDKLKPLRFYIWSKFETELNYQKPWCIYIYVKYLNCISLSN